MNESISDYYKAQIDDAPAKELAILQKQIAEAQLKIAQPSFLVTSTNQQITPGDVIQYSHMPPEFYSAQLPLPEPPQKKLTRFQLLLQKEAQ